MKIALLYSGAIRNLAETIYNNISCFEQVASEIDLYFSVWDHVGYVNHLNAPDYIKGNRKINSDETVTEEMIKKIVGDRANIVKIKIQKYNDNNLNFSLINDLDNKGLKAQYYKIFDAFSLVEESYDLLVRMRCDILMDKIPNLSNILNNRIGFFSRIWYNHYWQPGFRSINEMFWIAPPEIMKKACNIYNNSGKINDIILQKNQEDRNYGESICYMNLEAENISDSIEMLDIDYKVLR